jgi:hypothetical protein
MRRHLVLGFGVLVVLVSVLADVFRVGGEPGFGCTQGVGVLVGIALILAGLVEAQTKEAAHGLSPMP